MFESPVFWGCLLALLTVLCYFRGYRPSARRYDIIREVPTIDTKDLPGLGAAMVEVKGNARVDEPVLSDLTRLDCVAFKCSVTEHWTTTRTERDSDGKTRTVTEHHSETRYSNAMWIPFRVHDATGSVLVLPEGAAIEMLDGFDLAGVDRPAPESPAYGISPRHFGGHLSYHEELLPVEQWVYVLGQVNMDHDIAAPQGVNRPFVISHRTEEALLSRARWGKAIYGVLTVLLFLATFVTLGVGLGLVDDIGPASSY